MRLLHSTRPPLLVVERNQCDNLALFKHQTKPVSANFPNLEMRSYVKNYQPQTTNPERSDTLQWWNDTSDGRRTVVCVVVGCLIAASLFHAVSLLLCWAVRLNLFFTPSSCSPDLFRIMCFSPSPQHGKNGIFCISWSHKDSKRIATCSGDGFWQVLTVSLRFRRQSEFETIVSRVCRHFGNSIIRTIDGKILHKYKHPAAVFGCDWSQNNK